MNVIKKVRQISMCSALVEAIFMDHACHNKVCIHEEFVDPKTLVTRVKVPFNELLSRSYVLLCRFGLENVSRTTAHVRTDHPVRVLRTYKVASTTAHVAVESGRRPSFHAVTLLELFGKRGGLCMRFRTSMTWPFITKRNTSTCRMICSPFNIPLWTITSFWILPYSTPSAVTAFVDTLDRSSLHPKQVQPIWIRCPHDSYFYTCSMISLLSNNIVVDHAPNNTLFFYIKHYGRLIHLSLEPCTTSYMFSLIAMLPNMVGHCDLSTVF